MKENRDIDELVYNWVLNGTVTIKIVIHYFFLNIGNFTYFY